MYRHLILPVLLGFFLIFVCDTAKADLLFEDDFEDGSFGNKWDIVIGNWEVVKVDGNHAARHIGDSGSETIVIRDMIFDDFIAEMRILHVSDSSGAQMYWRTNEGPGNAAGNGYIFGENALDNIIRWYRVADGSPTIQDKITDIDITPDTWTWFKVRIEGSHAQMWYKREDKDEDYILAFEVDDLNEYQEGTIGTWVGGEVLIDDVRVADLKGFVVEPYSHVEGAWGNIKVMY
ncbi:hypothetical protein GF312_12400 [Candidatus Poribacteria bacterium]|nr:hypothetical protein [Candidatus Poribacteria bacterium]